MFFTPKWIKLMPNLKSFLSNHQLNELENLRNKINLPHELFLRILLTSPELGRVLVQNKYDYASRTSNKTDKEIFCALLMEDFLLDLDVTENERQLSIKAQEIVQRVDTIDQLCDYITDITKQKVPGFDIGPIGKKITDIIKEGSQTNFQGKEALLSMNKVTSTNIVPNLPPSDTFYNETITLYGSSSILSGWVEFIDYEDGKLLTTEVDPIECVDVPVLESYVLIENKQSKPIEISVFDFTLFLTDGTELPVYEGNERWYAPRLDPEFLPMVVELNGRDISGYKYRSTLLREKQWAVFEISFLMYIGFEDNSTIKLANSMKVLGKVK